MADKYSPSVVEALTQALAAPAGLPLLAAKSQPGLFPATTLGKAASAKAVELGLLEPHGRGYRCTERGRHYLLEAESPKQLLADFLRILEAQHQHWLDLTRQTIQLGETLGGLREALGFAMPKVQQARIAADLPSEAIADRLRLWASQQESSRDCPLPELYRAVQPSGLGCFHDALRSLHAANRIYLHPWTGPLYAMPEPAFALLIGHEIAYYASPRRTERNLDFERRPTLAASASP